MSEETNNTQEMQVHNFEVYSIPVENIEKVSDETLIDFAIRLENIFENTALAMLVTENKQDKLGAFLEDIPENDVRQLIESPTFAVLKVHIGPILGVEEEMKRRNMLEDFRKNHSFLNYETGEFFTYDSFFYRLAHLIELTLRGAMYHDNVQAKLLEVERQRAEAEIEQSESEEMPTVLN